MLPVAVMLGCGGGGSILVAEGSLMIKWAVDSGCRALKCGTNRLHNEIRLMRTTPSSDGYSDFLTDLTSDMV